MRLEIDDLSYICLKWKNLLDWMNVPVVWSIDFPHCLLYLNLFLLIMICKKKLLKVVCEHIFYTELYENTQYFLFLVKKIELEKTDVFEVKNVKKKLQRSERNFISKLLQENVFSRKCLFKKMSFEKTGGRSLE